MEVGVTHGSPGATLLALRRACSSSSSGETIVSPGSRQGSIPKVIPLTQNLSDSVDQYIHRILVEEDATSQRSSDDLYHASSEAGKELYNKGDFAQSQIKNLEAYPLKKVDIFPDVLKSKVTRHFDKGDEVSAMVIGEFYTKEDLFPRFGCPFAFDAKILLRVGLASKAKDAARAALKPPWWTLGCTYEVSWDEAAFLLDSASVEGTGSDHLEPTAECYEEGGLDDIAKFVLYRD